MKKNAVLLLGILLSCLSGTSFLYGQQSGERDLKISSASLNSIDSKYKDIEQSLQKHTSRLLAKMQGKEARLVQSISRKDSLAGAKAAKAKGRYDELQSKLNGCANLQGPAMLKEYIPAIDSLHTAMRFLEQKAGNLSPEQLKKVSAISNQLSSLEGSLQQANNVKAFIKERQQQLKTELERLNLGKELKAFNKEVYYYSQRLQEYKSLINDRKKLEEKALAMVRDLPAFKDFMQKNSYLSQLFGMPNNYGTPAALAGLQTRGQVSSIISQRMGVGGGTAGNPDMPQPDPASMMQQQIQAAQAQVNQLKDKINKLGGSSSDMEVPDFKPNSQKTKSVWKRLEYGCNLQTAASNGLLPSTIDIGLSLGYKLNDRSVIGIGGSYKIGLGKPVSHMELSSQGVGLRSFLDIKMKGSIWVTGGYEYNYQQAFKDLNTIQNLDVWQKSGLIGLSKKFKAGRKDGKLQLLWDFLSYTQVPRGQAIKFRVGYTL